MTCIVALEENGVIYIGADSAGVNPTNLSISSRADEKAFVNETGEFAMGFCGSFRLGQLLRYSVTPPDQPSKKDDMAYMVTDFIDAVRTVLKDKGALKKENELEEHDSQFIVGYKGKLYVVEEDLQVAQPIENYVSVGCGCDLALGVMYATRNMDMKPETRLTLALQAAVEYSAGVRPPFHIVKLEHKG